MIKATFQGEAWINDYAIPVDDSYVEWDATAFAAENAAYVARMAEQSPDDLDDEFGITDNDDLFRSDPAAPGLVHDWSGPFTIRLIKREAS